MTADDDALERVRRSERDGLRLALLGRSVALVVAAVWFLAVGSWPAGKLVGIAVLAFAAAGYLYRAQVGGPRDRPVYPYLLVTIDVVAVASSFVLVPLLQDGTVPQILAFRAYGVYYFLIFLGAVALTFSPRLLIWTGCVIVASWWGAFALVVAGMERTVSWGDLPADADGRTYVALLLDPDFIGVGNRIEESIVVLATAGLLALAVERQRRVLRRWIEADRQRSRVQELFGRFVPESVTTTLVAGDGALEPVRRDASILFLDVGGFTKFSESRSPQQVIAAMDGLFGLIGRIVSQHGGVVVGHQGDGLLAAFNLPVEQDGHAGRAIAAARDVLEAVAERHFAGVSLSVRIGVHSGPVAAGLVGGGDRQSYTVYGDTVNVASRLEQANKRLGTALLVSGAAVEAAGVTDLRALGPQNVRGHAQPVPVFTLPPSCGR